MDELLKNLESLYARLDASLPGTEGNSCGECTGCCSRRHIVMHRISLLEMEYLSRHTDSQKMEQFREYVTGRRREDGELLCPLYDRESKGCSVYPFRPLSCRIFGHYFLEGTTLPGQCTFREKGTWFKAGQYFTVIPFAEEFRSLHRLHLSKRPYTTQSISEELRYAEGIGIEALSEEGEFCDVLDRALHFELKGKLQAAYDIFASEKQPDSPYFYYYFGNLCDEMERHQEAVEHFRKAIALKGDDSLFHFRLGLDLVMMGFLDEALEAFYRVIELNPQNALALGYAGYLHLHRGELEKAQHYYQQALALDPEQHYFRFRLALTFLGLRKGKEAEALLREMKDYEPLKNDVSYLLGEIEKINAGSPLSAS